MHRHREFRGDGDKNTAARSAVELGHCQPGDTDSFLENLDLRQRILADRGIEHEEHGVRRLRVDLFGDTDDLVQFFHQFGAVLQPPCGIDKQNIGPALLRRHNRVEGKTGGVGAGFARNEACAGALRPDFELLDGGGAERIAGREHHRAAFSA
jgi:hypothetical protein